MNPFSNLRFKKLVKTATGKLKSQMNLKLYFSDLNPSFQVYFKTKTKQISCAFPQNSPSKCLKRKWKKKDTPTKKLFTLTLKGFALFEACQFQA